MATAPTPVRHFREIGSTNTAAKDAFDDGLYEACWFTADRQTHGVGRRGRAWHQPEGNFAGSLLWPVDAADLRRPALYALLASLSVMQASRLVVPEGEFALKWPNDVLLGGAKLSGILIENASSADRLAVIVGIGVNIAAHPDLGEYLTTSLASHLGAKPLPSPQMFVSALDDCWRTGWQTYQQKGYQAVQEAWLQHSIGLNEKLTVKMQHETLIGEFAGLDADGALLLRLEDKIQRIIAADIYLGEVVNPGGDDTQKVE